MRAFTVLLLGVLVALEAVELTPRFADTPTAGTLLEWELRDAPAAWLVTDVERTPRLIITAPDGVAVTRSAFIYQVGKRNTDPAITGEYIAVGARGLRIRHTARQAGRHRWQLVDPEGAQLAAGELTVAAGDGPQGPIRIHPRNPRLLAYADGTAWIPIGPNIAWALPDRLVNLERYFARLAEQGGTHARLWLASWCGQFEGTEPDAYDLPAAWVVDEILASARRHGLRLTIVIDNHHDLVHGKRFPYGNDYIARARNFLAAKPSAQYQRKLRYLLARWGADDTVAVWELFNEVDMACIVREIAIPWITGASELFHGLDQDQRLTTVSWAGPDWDRAFAATAVDLVQLRAYVHEWLDIDEDLRARDRDGVGLMLADAARANQGSRPFFFGESGYQGLELHNPGNESDPQGLLLRQQAWAGFLLGGCGSGMNWWWDVYIDANGLWGIYGGLAKAVEAIDWNDPELLPLTPNEDGHLRVIGWRSPRQALLWPQMRIDTWFEHLVDERERPVFPHDASLPVPGFVPGQSYAVRWQHQVTAQAAAEATVIADETGILALTMPAAGHDLVVLIRPIPKASP